MSDAPIPRLPKGFRDTFEGDLVARRKMLETICGVYSMFGFAPLETPGIEYLDALGKYLPESDAPNSGVFALRDDDKQWISLRYDLTAPLARFVAEHPELPKPFRRFQFGPVWRREQKPGATRFREFLQCDFDTVGTASLVADAEVCGVLSASMRALGISDDKFVIRVNNRKILNGVLDNLSIFDESKRLTILRSIDKLDKVSIEGVQELLGGGRFDPISGEFTKGAELTDHQITTVCDLLTSSAQSRLDVCESLERFVHGVPSGMEGVSELRGIDSYLQAMCLGSAVVTFDPSVVRGLEYYTGPVFEVELNFEIMDEDGRKGRFGSVAGGGRYDYLVERFTGNKVPATGASIGVDRLLSALHLLGRIQNSNAVGPVIVTAMDKAHIDDYLHMVTELRRAGVSAELYLGDAGFRHQMRYVDRRNSPIAIIAGSDEFASNTIILKDMFLGSQLAEQLSDNTEWRKTQRAQLVVRRAEMVAAVQEMLSKRNSNA